jgi:DNA mismatch repair protein MutS
MLLTTDQQTIEDLNIFGKHFGASIYTMFNRTFTRGGAALLEDMFRFPLSDADAINKRSGIIRYFSATQDFPFDNELFGMAEQYLGNIDERTKLSDDGYSIMKKLNNLIAQDAIYKFVHTGVIAFIAIINRLRNFADTLTADKESPYQQDLAAISGLLSQPSFNALPKTNRKSKLSYVQVAKLDVILRFQQRETLKKILHHIYQLDVYISVGHIAIEKGFVFAKALPQEMHLMQLEGVYHPQLKAPVPNNFRLTLQSNTAFLTGANMAGKSTFMKSLGIAIYLAHMGFPVAAKRMDFSAMDGIYTTVNLPDNLGTGTSHFYAEVLRVKKVAKELGMGKNLFVIFDELFRGTNVKDAYEATIAITAAFAQKRNSMFVISTHIIEAGEILKEACENIGFSYLPTHLNGNTPVYTYTLQEGITADRHGMIIINNEGIIELLRNGKIKAS